MSALPSNPSESTRKRNPHLYGPFNAEDTARMVVEERHPQTAVQINRQQTGEIKFHGRTLCEVFASEGKKRLRQSSKGPNKTEREYFDRLRQDCCAFVVEQSVTFKLANGVRYTPDAVVVKSFGFGVECHEVKGFMRDDAAVKLKLAAKLYPFFVWKLAWKENGTWRTQTILP